MRAYHRPEGCSPRSLFSRRLAASPAETLRQRLHGRVHSPPASLADYSSARFACPPSREDLRAGFPCALGHPWLVTLAPANWGPVFLRTRDVRHRGCQEYAGRRFCLENKLCASCANEVEIERVAIPGFLVDSRRAALEAAVRLHCRRDGGPPSERHAGRAWGRGLGSSPDPALAMLQEEVDAGAQIAYLPIMLQGSSRQAEADVALKQLVAY